MSQTLARAVSILGHPLLVLPAAALWRAWGRLHIHQTAWMALGFAALVTLVMGGSVWQVRQGRWRHVDASGPRERRSLNLFLLIVLTVAAGVSRLAGMPAPLSLGLALAAALIAIALLTAQCCTLSLHLAFGVYAAGLLVDLRNGIALLVAVALLGLLAWSRLALSRHTPRDLLAGAIAGAAAGFVFCWLMPALPG